jgi:hypothetical protein
MTRRFNKFGLRRDLNFSDLTNPQQSLNNVLNGLVDVQGESFISQDLDAVRDIAATTITNNDFRSITGAALKVTDSAGLLAVYKPVVKFKNRLDIARFTVGEPNFYGGDGLTTRYYESDQINSNAASVNNIFTGTEQVKEVFWERGIFNFIAKINDRFSDVYGGIQWDGYFRPTVSGRWRFGLLTSGYYTFEIDDGAGNLILVGRKSAKNTNIVVNAATAGTDFITLTTATDIQKVLVGDVIVHGSIAQFEDTEEEDYANAITVTEIDYTGSRVRISSVLDENLANGTTLIFRHRIGETTSSINYLSTNLEQYNTYRIRFRFWIPDEPEVTARAQKTLTLTVVPPNSTTVYLNYKWLYNEEYTINPTAGTPAFGDFRTFYTSKLDSSGGTVGGQTYATYQSVISKAPVNVSYGPPVSLAAATPQTKTVNLTSGTNNMPMTLTDGIAVGQYIFGTGVPLGARVKSISINEGVFMTLDADLTTSSTVVFIDHRGLITYSTSVSVTNGNSSVELPSDVYNAVNVGDIIVASNLPQYAIITRKAGSNTVVLSDAPTSTASVAMYFYRSTGILNNTLTTYCANVVSAPTVAQSNSGATTLTLAYVDGIDVNDVVQFGTRIPSATLVTNVNSSTKVVTLSKALTDDIPVGQLITFAPAGTTDNKELCFPPIDTSPPFTATPLGLTTTSGRPSINIAPTGGALGELKFVGLSADGVTVAQTTPTAAYNRALRIRDSLGREFRILSTNV